MNKQLTPEDQKVLKYEKRIGFVFGGLILCFGGLFNLFFFVGNKSGNGLLIIGLIDLVIIFLSIVVCNRINLKINRDLKDNIKEVIIYKVLEKFEEKSYEAGSGTLNIPILGELFPKLWGQKMNETNKYYILTSENKFEVNKDLFDSLKKHSDFYLHQAKHSEKILNFSNDV